MAWDDSRSRIGACRLLSRCRTDVFDDCAVPRLFVDIVKLPLKPSFGYFGRSKKPDRHRQLKYL